MWKILWTSGLWVTNEPRLPWWLPWYSYPLPMGPGAPLLLSSARTMLWESLCPALSLAGLSMELPGLILDLTHSFAFIWWSLGCHQTLFLSAPPCSPCSGGCPVGEGTPSAFAWSASSSSPLMEQPHACCPLKMGLKGDLLNANFTHVLLQSDRQAPGHQVVCPALRHQDAWIQESCWRQGPTYWDLTLSLGLFSGGRCVLIFAHAFSYPLGHLSDEFFHSVPPFTSMNCQLLITILFLWSGCLRSWCLCVRMVMNC